jgi:Tol biopolymer transport system component
MMSPDGSRIIFMSNRNGKFDLFEKSATGAGDEQALLVNAQDKSPRDWSPDGRFLLYAAQGEKTASDLWALPLAGERKPVPVAQSAFDEAQGQFSPDGRWLAYASNETGRYEIYVRPFPAAGGKWQVSLGGGIYPRWRRDGKELFYVAPDNKLMAVPIQAGPQAGTLLYGASVALFATRMVVSGSDVYSGGLFSAAQYVDAADSAASPINVVLNWTAGLKP